MEDPGTGGKKRPLRTAYLVANLAIITGLFVLSIGAFLVSQMVDSGAVVFLMQRFFHDIELSLPTLYNYFLLVANFGLLAAIVLAIRAQDGSDLYHWLGLTVVMLLLSYDEAAEVHEDIARRLSDVLPSSPFLTYAWTPIGAVVVIVFAALYIPFLRRLPRRVSRLMFAGGVVYVTGALVVETLGGWLDFYFGQDLRYHVVSAIEESMEMGGMVIFGYALLVYLAQSFRPAEFGID